MNKETANKINHLAKLRLEYFGKKQQYIGWALDYVEAEYPIPRSWTNAFINEVTLNQPGYIKQLEDSIRYFGVRWSKE